MKYVHCKHHALVNGKYKDDNGKEQRIQFYPFILDKYTGQPKHTGYTEVSEKILEKLRRDSVVFNAFEKSGKLIVLDDIPASAMTPAGLLAKKDKEIAELKAKLKESDNADALEKQRKKYESELKELRKQLSVANSSVKELKNLAEDESTRFDEEEK